MSAKKKLHDDEDKIRVTHLGWPAWRRVGDASRNSEENEERVDLEHFQVRKSGRQEGVG